LRKRKYKSGPLADSHPSLFFDNDTKETTMAYSIESTVQELLDNEATKAIVDKHLPGLSSHPSIGMARSMGLSTVANFSGGLISQEALQKIDAELKALG
jgi:hypothetical protein